MKYGLKEDGYITTPGELPGGFTEVTQAVYETTLAQREADALAEFEVLRLAQEQELAINKQSAADKLRVSSDLSDAELAVMGLPSSTAVYAPPSGFPAGTLAERQAIADKFAEGKKFSLTDNELAALGLPSSDEN